MLDVSNKVVYHPKGSYIEHLATGARTPLIRENDIFVLELLVDLPASQSAMKSAGFPRPR